MYILPDSVDYYDENGVIHVTPKLHQNTVKPPAPAIQEELRAILRCGGCPEITTPLSCSLREQELPADEKEIENALGELRGVMQNSLLLTIMPTEGCNFRCHYCYEDHAPISMRRKTLDQIQAYIAAQAPRFRHIGIAWFGGEPTLCKDVILETSELIQSLQETHSFRYTASMTTNGYLLGLEDFRKYYHAGITAYQITLDGWDHNKTRPHVSGRGTLYTILDNLTAISALPREQYRFHITIRHNILAGDEDFSWYDHLYSLFGGDSRFSVMVRPVGDWGGDSVQPLNILAGESRNELMRKHVDYLNRIGMQCENGKRGILSQICYANYPHSMVFRASGKIEKCTVCLDHPKNRLGQVDPVKGIVLDETVNQLWSLSALKPECYHCADVLSCLNMRCPVSRIIYGADASQCARCTADVY